ncbi:sel1 repeat family protein [Aeromonas caviae]|uniref:tetratricopeptide repeat protein n=2 Tax=Aeromonas caviae TaxID=648 RepID=UPI00191DB012|nr:tetratricopeptide repeat protein [Aeromonas caviae]MBL0439807.1 sel1 repeat family protein [Aeromonas caviae]
MVRDNKKTLKNILRKAHDGDVNAMLDLGLIYQDGIIVPKDYELAKFWYEMAVEGGDTSVLRYLGAMYEHGLGVQQDLDYAHKCYQTAADAGDPGAMFNLGLMYQNGCGVPPNSSIALSWFEKSAEACNTNAMYNLGVIYKQGLGTPQNTSLALKWFKKAADAGNDNAKLSLGLMYFHGDLVVNDFLLAKEFFEQAANAGNSIAMDALGVIYQQGHGVVQSFEQARMWYEQATNAGNARSMFNIGCLYHQGLGVSINLTQAKIWYERAAKAGDTSGMGNLGKMYLQGIGVTQNFQEAFRWLELAVEGGNINALVNLGLIYQKGLGISSNLTKARDLYERAVNYGNVGAMVNLGLMYLQSDGTNQDYSQAFKWMEQAANTDNCDAMANLGLMYKQGLGVKQDYNLAYYWLTKAVNAGDASAMVNLGLMYQQGLGINQDLALSRELWKKAADKGHAAAMFNLGLMYQQGEGTHKNSLEASTWWLRAADNGHADAMFNLATIYQQNGTKEDIEQAKKWYENAALLGVKTGWVALVELDYLYSSVAKVNTNNGMEYHSTQFKDWSERISEEDFHTNAIPNPPMWLDSYIKSEMNEIASPTLERGEDDEIVRLLALIRLLAQWKQAQHLIATDTTLYHFTRYDVLEKLLSKSENNNASRNVLRCYHVSYMNDPSEGRRLLDFNDKSNSCASRAAEKLSQWFDDELGGYFHQIDNAITVKSLPASVFTASFTQRSDSLDLWRAYGNDGKGVSISLPVHGTNELYLKSPSIMGVPFTLSKIENNDLHQPNNDILSLTEPFVHKNESINPRYYRVEYDDHEIVKTLSLFYPLLTRLDSCLMKIEESEPEDASKWKEISRKYITDAFINIIYLYKDENYSSEREVRAIEIHSLYDEVVLGDERSPKRLFCELPGCSLFTAADTEIIVGPKAEDYNAMIWDVRHRLAKLGYGENVTVKRSRVKYR